MGMLVVSELRKMTDDQLQFQLKELQNLYQKKHSKKVEPMEIRTARKDIARIKMVQHEKKLEKLAEEFKGKKFIPKELRLKKTRAIRRSLTDKQKNLKNRRKRIM